jgi:hypothetical protein
MRTQMPLWVEYVQALGTPIAAFIFGAVAALISYKQYQMSVHKYRHDLFERRYKVYAAIADIFGEILREDKVSPEAYSKFVSSVEQAKFLFGDEIKAYIDKLFELIFEKRNLERKIARRHNDDNFDKWSDELDRNWDSITAMMKEVTKMFAKYLKLPR